MLFFIFFITTLSTASVPLSNIPCFEQVTKALDQVGTPLRWHQFPGGVATRFEDGSVVEIYPEKSQTTFVLSKNGDTTKFFLESPGCNALASSEKVDPLSFRDIDFAELLTKSSRGVIYVWSPHMVLSVEEASRLKNEKHSVDVLVLMDPTASEDKSIALMKQKSLPASYRRRVTASSILKADIGIHYPSTVFYKDGKILKRVPGYHGESGLRSLIKTELQ